VGGGGGGGGGVWGVLWWGGGGGGGGVGGGSGVGGGLGGGELEFALRDPKICTCSGRGGYHYESSQSNIKEGEGKFYSKNSGGLGRFQGRAFPACLRTSLDVERKNDHSRPSEKNKLGLQPGNQIIERSDERLEATLSSSCQDPSIRGVRKGSEDI